MFRAISLYFRRRAERKGVRSVLDTRQLWEQELVHLPPMSVKGKRLALIRLDDIGDYLLFRNFLPEYRLGKWSGYEITLIGNHAWKSLFETFDSVTADDTLWIDKNRYFGDEAYRAGLWHQLRAAGFAAVICPSRTRPLLLDDMLVLAAAAPERLASANTFTVPEWNMVSDGTYSRLFSASAGIHEFTFNRHFSNWANEGHNEQKVPELPAGTTPAGDHIVCFIGASAKSRRWPQAYWIALVRQLQQLGLHPVVAGGKQDQETAEIIAAATGAPSYAGKTSLPEAMALISTSKAVISGDTMAAHAAVSYGRPLVVLGNGSNEPRFVRFQSLELKQAITLYTRAYRKHLASGSRRLFCAVSSDMKSIHPREVEKALLSLL